MRHRGRGIAAGIAVVVLCTTLLLPGNVPRERPLLQHSSPRTSGPPDRQNLLSLARQSLLRGNGPSGSASPVPIPGNWSLHCHGPCSTSPNLVYDPLHHYVFLLYGCSEHPTYACSSWKFSNGTWSSVPITSGPGLLQNPGNTWASLAWDAADGYILAFGGQGLVGGSWVDYNVTWAFQGVNWTKINGTHAPSVRDSAQMIYDPDIHSVVLFGGMNNSQPLNDTWTYSGGIWTQYSTPQRPSTVVAPSGMAYDSAHHALILLGVGGVWPNVSLQTWQFLANFTWLLLNSSLNSLFYVYAKTITYDAHDGYVLLYGLRATVGSLQSQTWAFSYSTKSWAKLSPGNPPPATVAGPICFDGQFNFPFLLGADSAGAPGDYVFNGTSWVRLFPAPLPRADAGLAYDAAGKYALLFGGTSGGLLLNDSWKFSNGSWTQLHPTRAPSPRSDFGFAYDSAISSAVLFGGIGANAILNDTWEFSGGNWARVPSPHAPAARFLGVMTYDVVDTYVVLFGGCALGNVVSCTTYLNDTWRFSNGSWAPVLTALHPPGLYGSSMAYYPFHPGLLLVGGYGPAVNTSKKSHIHTASWFFSHGRWSVPNGGGLLGLGAFEAQIAYDPHLGLVLLFGGVNSQGNEVNAVFENGTWTNAAIGGYYPPDYSMQSATWDTGAHALLVFGGIGAGPKDETLTFG
jgi:hypothetical protein